jgi:hypothetical protein
MGFFSGITKAIKSVAEPLVGGAFGFAGSALEGEYGQSSAATANAFTKEQLQNRHQWEVADLRKAGLNPILSAMKGAPSIGGSAAAPVPNFSSNASTAASTALSAQKLKSEIELLESQATAAKTQGVKNLADARNTGNIGNITQNLGNLASGFHGLSTNAASRISKNLNDAWDIPDIIKKVQSDKKKSDYQSPSSRIFNRLFKKGN